MSLREQILAVQDLVYEEIAVPEWGIPALRVRGLTELESSQFERVAFPVPGAPPNPLMRAQLVVLGVVDAEGRRVFTDEDAPELAQRNGAVVKRLFDVIWRLSGYRAADLEEARGNSSHGHGGGSSSDSR